MNNRFKDGYIYLVCNDSTNWYSCFRFKCHDKLTNNRNDFTKYYNKSKIENNGKGV